MISTRKLSRSTVQQEAEAYIRQLVSEEFGVVLAKSPPIDTSPHHHVLVDGRCRDPKVLIEISARIGELRAAQFSKIAKDILKFSVIRDSNSFWKNARMCIVDLPPNSGHFAVEKFPWR